MDAAATAPAAPAAAARGRRAWLEPALVAAALGIVYLAWAPPSADLAAQEFRTWLFEDQGPGIWNGQWFGGHHTPGYSVLFPPLAALLGPRVVGVLAAVAAAAAFGALADRTWGGRARLGALWFGAATATNLFTGRLTFALGVAVGLGALLALQRDRRVLGLGLAAATAPASPVAALFLGLAGVAWAVAAALPAGPRRVARAGPGAGLAAAAVLPAVALSVAFPEGGTEPFVASAFIPVVIVVAAALVVLPGDERILRVGAALYGLAVVASFVLDTPMGGNVTRLETLFAGPLLACALWGRRTVVLCCLAPVLLYFQWGPPVRDVRRASNDPTVSRSYYTPLLRFFAAQPGPFRAEVLPTEDHWESRWVAPEVPLARGWVRQLDRKFNALFYDEGALTPRSYRAWLERLGVRYVAVPAGPLDYAAVDEARLVRSGAVAGLTPVFRSAQWRVWEVAGAALARGPAIVSDLTPDGVSLVARARGTVLLRVRWSPYWALAAGSGCVQRAPGDLTRLRLTAAGPARLEIRFAPGRVVFRGPRCRAGP